MHSRFETHLDTMEQQMRGLPAGERREMREEAAQHLQALAAAHRELGEESDAAIDAALRSFGDPVFVGQGVRRESQRRHQRTRAHRLFTGMSAGALGGLTFAFSCALPLIVEGHDMSGLYASLGAMFGVACLLRLRRVAWGIGGLFAAFAIALPALLMHEYTESIFAAMTGPTHGGADTLLSGIQYFLASGFRWSSDANILRGLLPVVIAGGFLWSRKRSVSLRQSIVVTALLYALFSVLDEVPLLLRHGYLTTPLILWDDFWSALSGAQQGAISGLFLGLAHIAVNFVLKRRRAAEKCPPACKMPVDKER